MINVALFIIGFLITAGTFGTQFIAGVDLMQYWLWFAAGLVTIFSILFVDAGALGAAFAAAENNLRIPVLAPIGGGIIGALVSIMLLGTTYVQLWLSYFIMNGIPKTATSFAEFPVNTQYAIYAFVAIMVIGTIHSINFKSK